LAIEHILVDSPDVLLISIVPNLAIRVEIPRGAKIDEVSCTADMDQLALAGVLLLACNDGGDWLAGEGVAGVDGDVVLFTSVFDFFEVAEVADDDAVGVEVGLKLVFWLSASYVGGDLPVWVCLLDGSCVGSCTRKLGICKSQAKICLRTADKARSTKDDD
jgi:hypothetical protein